MINIAVVEDSVLDFEDINKKLARCSEECGIKIGVSHFSSGLEFLGCYKSDTDIVFMDIELPDIDGLEASARLRKSDSGVAIVFVTNMAHLAIKGYEVEAVDFVVKPINYYKLRALMQKLSARAAANRNAFVTVHSGQTTERIGINEIIYVEIEKHRIVYHTSRGDVVTSGTMGDCERLLPQRRFLRCYQSFMVNLKYIVGCTADEIKLVNGVRVPISRARRKEVMGRLNDFFMNGEE